MKICAVTTEFNPFHNGHKYLANQIKSQNFTHVIGIMSGNFVQRGEPAILRKEARVKIALKNGFDLIAELPASYAVSSAHEYAHSAVSIAESFGCVNALVFGSETQNISDLQNLSEIIRENSEYIYFLKKYLSCGETFAKARELAITAVTKSNITANILHSPNNILGLEYLMALKNLGSGITPIAIPRLRRFYNSENAGCISASEIRDLIISNKDYSKYVPETSFEIINNELKTMHAPSTLKNAEKAIIYALRTMTSEDFLQLSDVNEGLENRIISAVRSSCSLAEIFDKIKTKRYTMSRIKRIILCAFLKISKSRQKIPLPYIRVLGANSKGLDILKKAKNSCKVPIVSRGSEIAKLGKDSQKIFEIECRTGDIYDLFSPKTHYCGSEQTFKIITGDML